MHQTEGPRGKHSCAFAHVAGGNLLLACITVGEPEQYEEVFGKVTVYEIEENPVTHGRGALTYQFVHDIDVASPRYVETWCGYDTPDAEYLS